MSYTKLRLCLSTVAALLLFGCGSNETSTTPSIDSGVPAGQQSSAKPQSGMALFVGNALFNDDPGQVSVLHVDSHTGSLTELAASPFASMQNIGGFLPIADGKFLLYWNAQFHPATNTPNPDPVLPDTSGLYRVQLGPSGEFVGDPVLVSKAFNFPTAQADASGKHVFIENPSGQAIDVFAVDQTTGELSLQPELGVSFSQPIALRPRTGDKLWVVHVGADPVDPHKTTYETVNIGSTGKLSVDDRQLSFDFSPDATGEGFLVISHDAVFLDERLLSGQERHAIFGEQANGFVSLPACPAQFSQLCSFQPFLTPAGDRAVIFTPGKLWSIPFDPIAGLHFNEAKVTALASTVGFANAVFSDDGKFLYGNDNDTGGIIGFVADNSGAYTQLPGGAVHTRNGFHSPWVALALGKTLQ